MMLGIGSGRRLPTVLIIDDDLVSREVMATVLTMTGFTVHTAADGSASLTKIESEMCVPSVILMDAQMPGLNGLELIVELRRRSKASIYVMSGSQPPDELTAAADGFLMKPVSPEALQRMLREHETFVPPAVPAETPVLSATVVAQLRGLMPETAVQQIYDSLESDLTKRRANLQLAFDAGDEATLRRLGHTIKGGCGMAGAMEIARLGELLESGGDQSDNTRAILTQLEEASINLHRMLDSEFPSRKSDAAV